MTVKQVLGFTALLVFITASHALAGWTVTYLNPTGSTASAAYGGSGSQQVGYIFSDHHRASLWSGTAGSCVDLHPSGYGYSRAYASSGGQQVGYATASGNIAHAGLWSGTAESWVDLCPTNRASHALGVSGTKQAGWTSSTLGTDIHAALWSGTAASWVDLNPSWASSSKALAISGSQEVGYANGSTTAYTNHAGLWTGTASSWVDLNPAGSSASMAYGVSGGKQVGYIMVGSILRATLWSGTVMNYTSLNPAGWANSVAFGISGPWQVGLVRNSSDGSDNHACLWKSSSSAWENLHTYLGSDYSYSAAQSIGVVDGELWVSGWAYNSTNRMSEAILWHGTDIVPEPSSVLVLGMALPGLIFALRRRSG